METGKGEASSFKPAGQVEWYLAGSLGLGYVLVAVFMWRLNFNFMQGDAIGYWQDSFNLTSTFRGLYAPLYVWLLALIRTISFGALPPLLIMMGINFVCLLACVWLMYRIGRLSGASTEVSALAAAAFCLWPLVGLTYTVYPKTDIPALSIYLAGIYLLLRGRPWPAALALGIGTLAHFVLWPLCPLTVCGYWYSQQPRPAIRVLVQMLILAAIPLTLLVIAGTLVTGSLQWLYVTNATRVTYSHYLPILDGAVGTFLRGTIPEIFKGIFMAGLAIFAGWLAYQCHRRKPVLYMVGIGICVVIMTLWLILFSGEIWGMVRFSRLLVLPALWLVAQYLKEPRRIPTGWRTGVMGIVVLLVLSQFMYAWYMVKVFYD